MLENGLADFGGFPFRWQKDRLLLISGIPDDVWVVMERSGLIGSLGSENLFRAEENLTVATRRALLRTKEFLGTSVSPDVRIFYDKSRQKDK